MNMPIVQATEDLIFVQLGQGMRYALERMNQLTGAMTLFVLNEAEQLVGTLTDGDVRRGFLRNLSLEDPISDFMNTDFKSLHMQDFSLAEVEEIRGKSVKLLPILKEDGQIARVIDFSEKRSILPLDAIIMAGGRGSRLQPLTDTVPKPLLKIGDKPIIEHNIDRLDLFGIHHIYLSVRYLGEQLEDYFGNGSAKGLEIEYLWEDQPLGTIGAVRKAENLYYDDLLVMNSDLLTNIDYADFYQEFLSQEADLAVATTPYEVKVPYAVLETDQLKVVSFKEKPTYTYYSNAGIYLMKKSCLDQIPAQSFYNATDLMENLIQAGKKVIQYPIRGYWLDIGKPEDYQKAKEDIQHIKF